MCQNPNRSSNSNPNPSGEEQARDGKKQAQVQELARRLADGDAAARVQAARDIRKLARASAKARSAFAVPAVVQPLVSMLPSPDPESREAALLALLNLAVRNERAWQLTLLFDGILRLTKISFTQFSVRNKDKIVNSGAVPHLIELLRSEISSLRELATAAVLTLSASPSNKPTITSSGAVPLLVQILISGSMQGKVDAVTALYNLSTCKESLNLTLPVEAVKPLLILLKDSKKYSKFAEKAAALLEIISKTEEGRTSISEFDEGIQTLVETIEEGSVLSTEYAVGVLLSLCRSCRVRYRELILKEGPIPGLLLLTVEGTNNAQVRARELLDMLRDDSRPKRVASKDLETIVYDIATRVDGPVKAPETAKRLLQDMVKRNMESSIIRLQHRAASCTPKAPLI
ncbi:U-box domain-containing protein 14 [Cocos nucifera]|uniref:U-box domain-containing protein 14 n=1 Tax=Cocos nucifera TaxID=13894 RepID=A0A8K0IQK3_COCNU|nr:U-box domain-containing protein 14 [Cocos nucifera]